VFVFVRVIHFRRRRIQSDLEIQEHVGHLLDLGPLDIGRLDDFAAGRKTLRAADPQNRRTYEANHNANHMRSVLDAFRAERSEFVRRLEGFDEALILRSALYPRLQMERRVVDFAFFIAEHDNHHMAQITGLI
jgi:uncharacterized damage-inducible protein DinB